MKLQRSESSIRVLGIHGWIMQFTQAKLIRSLSTMFLSHVFVWLWTRLARFGQIFSMSVGLLRHQPQFMEQQLDDLQKFGIVQTRGKIGKK